MLRQSLRQRFVTVRRNILSFIDKRPLISFFSLLGLLLLLVVVGSFLRKPATNGEDATPPTKLVETYSFGESPKMAFTARVEKSGVITIVAQSPGVVQKIHLKEGQKVGRGGSLVSLSTNYQGGNAASLSRQIVQKNFEAAVNNFDVQKDIIAKQKEVAEKGNIQAKDLREITRKSLDETRSLISLNETIASSVDAQLRFLESMNVNGSSDSAILTARQGKAAVQVGLNQLRTGLRTAEYQSDENKTPAQIGDISKEIAIKQLELSERGLVLAKDMAHLNLKLAQVSESLMYPASPCEGVVERIHVKVGQMVSPGTVIATIKANQGENTAVVLVTADIAKQLSTAEAADFLIGGKKVSLYPRYISAEATDGNLHSVLFAIPSVYGAKLTNNTSIPVNIPLGSKQIVTDTLYIPLDSIYQTQEKSYVYVLGKDESASDSAKTKEISLGSVSGRFVRVTSGLSLTDIVILSRNVQDGEKVRTQ